jgi:hypothetical protein
LIKIFLYNGVYMKNPLVYLGFIVIVVIITFTLTRCGKSPDEETSGTPSTPSTPSTPGTPGAPTVTSVTITPATVSVAKGKTQTFTVKIAGTNNPAQTVTWSIVQTNKNSGTTINASGVLTVAASEALASLTVKATSTADTSKSGTASVSLTGASTGTEGGGIVNGETLTRSNSEQVTKKVNGYDYELWNQNKSGTASMTIAAGGSSANGGIFKCNWAGINNVLFRAGRKYNETQTHSEIGTIKIEYNADKFEMTNGSNNAYLSVYGWVSGGASGTTSDNLVEYYIVDNYGGYNPGTGGTNKGTVTLDGAVYTLYEKTINGPSIKNGINTFTQYLSVRAQGSKRLSGTINVSQHFAAWEAAGMTKIKTGKFYEVALKVESYGGTSLNAYGNAEITKNILSINDVPIK